MKKISLLALLLGVILLLSSCGGLPTDATELVAKMEDEGYEVRRTIGDDRIAEYVAEYGLVQGDVTAIVHAEKKSKSNDFLLTMGTFLYCKDESVVLTLKSAIEESLREQFGAVNNPAYHNFTVKQKGLIVFFGTEKVWSVAND